MISFYVRQGTDVKGFLRRLKVIALAESLGGVESLISQPSSMTHAGLSRQEREKIGITDNLLRLSVGIEDAEDLKADLEQALRS